MYKAAFLGPKAENAEELERLLLEVLRDHVFWRRNFHPGDPRLIEEKDKHTELYSRMATGLRDELFQILAEMKRAAPLYSPRQAAHMVSDPTMAALVGYFAGMLYNQNNVVAEVSPETVRKERAYMAALARMIAYPPFLPEALDPAADGRPACSWGHLCSGGTVANLEALWTMRNVRLFPLAVALIGETGTRWEDLGQIQVSLANGSTAPLFDARTFDLANLPVASILRLRADLRRYLADAGPDATEAFLKEFPSVRRLGIAGFLDRYNSVFAEDRCRLPVVLISQAAHYCWVKGMDVVGLGASQLVQLPVNGRIRLDIPALREALVAAAYHEQPVLGVISICGTTEEGSIDPLHEIRNLKLEMAGEGCSFWHHSDAALGGYFASMLPKAEDGSFERFDPSAGGWDDFTGPDSVLEADAIEAVRALSSTDSVTIDPHKFGYVPYPAGAVLFRDHNVRDFIGYDAPYLASTPQSGFTGFLGGWTLEGSRPGAAAVSCYLSQAVLPLDETGHGRLMKDCIRAAKRLASALESTFAEHLELQFRLLTRPDSAGFCFLLLPHDGITSLAQLNAYTQSVWNRMTVSDGDNINRYDFLLSKTAMQVDRYRQALDPLFDGTQISTADGSAISVTLLRVFIMNPFAGEWDGRAAGFSELFCEHLVKAASESMREAAFSHGAGPQPEPAVLSPGYSSGGDGGESAAQPSRFTTHPDRST